MYLDYHWHCLQARSQERIAQLQEEARVARLLKPLRVPLSLRVSRRKRRLEEARVLVKSLETQVKESSQRATLKRIEDLISQAENDHLKLRRRA